MRFVIVILFVSAGVAGCGGDSGGGDPAAAPQNSPVAATITKAGNGCLLSHNADAAVSYPTGAQAARTLLWNCANIDNKTRVGVEAFFTFDIPLNCYVEKGIGWKAGNCSQAAISPTTPTPAASVQISGTPLLVFIGGGNYALSVDFDATNIGNVSLFGAKVDLASLPSHFGSSTAIGAGGSISGLAFMPVSGQQHANGSPLLSNATTTGQTYSVTLTVLDFFNTPLSSTTFQISAP